MLRKSRSISLAIAVLLLALSIDFLTEALRKNESVEDGAGLMTEAERGYLSDTHDKLLAGHDIDYRVVTARGLGDLDRATVSRFQTLAASLRSEFGRGLLLVVDADQNLVRLEVGYALEGAFPGAFVAYIEQRQMVPFFEHGRVADGILAATESIATRARNAAANAGLEIGPWASGSGDSHAPERIPQ